MDFEANTVKWAKFDLFIFEFGFERPPYADYPPPSPQQQSSILVLLANLSVNELSIAVNMFGVPWSEQGLGCVSHR